MPTLPITLPSGMIGIYGIGVTGTTPSGLVIEENFRYGTVYNIWDGGATYIYGNDVVIFKEGDQYCRVVTASDNNQWTLIEFSKVVTDNIIVAP